MTECYVDGTCLVTRTGRSTELLGAQLEQSLMSDVGAEIEAGNVVWVALARKLSSEKKN